MLWLISGMIIILYLGIKLIYREYQKDLAERDRYISNCMKRINELEKMENRMRVNEQLIEWLFDELRRKNIISIEKEGSDKKWIKIIY